MNRDALIALGGITLILLVLALMVASFVAQVWLIGWADVNGFADWPAWQKVLGVLAYNALGAVVRWSFGGKK